VQYYIAVINFFVALVWYVGMPQFAVTAETVFHFVVSIIFVFEVSLRVSACRI